jgi:hypothetical protein
MQFVAGGSCLAETDSRLLLQTASPGCLDVDLDLGRMSPRGGLIGERFLTPKSKLVLSSVIAERLAMDVAPLGTCLVHHPRCHAGENKRRRCGDHDQKHCVESYVGPLDL